YLHRCTSNTDGARVLGDWAIGSTGNWPIHCAGIMLRTDLVRALGGWVASPIDEGRADGLRSARSARSISPAGNRGSVGGSPAFQPERHKQWRNRRRGDAAETPVCVSSPRRANAAREGR